MKSLSKNEPYYEFDDDFSNLRYIITADGWSMVSKNAPTGTIGSMRLMAHGALSREIWRLVRLGSG